MFNKKKIETIEQELSEHKALINELNARVQAAYEDSEKNKVLYDPERDMWLSRVNGFRSFISRKDKATLFSKKEAEFIKTQFHEELEIQNN